MGNSIKPTLSERVTLLGIGIAYKATNLVLRITEYATMFPAELDPKHAKMHDEAMTRTDLMNRAASVYLRAAFARDLQRVNDAPIKALMEYLNPPQNLDNLLERMEQNKANPGQCNPLYSGIYPRRSEDHNP